MLRQDALDHPDDFVADRYYSSSAGTFARGLVLATLIIRLEVGLMRDEP